MAAAAAATWNGALVTSAGSSKTNARCRHSSSLPFPSRLRDSPRRRFLHVAALQPAPSLPADPPHASSSGSICCSDIATPGKKPLFLYRSWSAQDVGIASFLVAVHLACLLAPFHFTWQAFRVFLAMYAITGLVGITLSYHRNLSHKSFTLPKWLEYLFAYCGALALQGDPLEWVSAHRYHHKHCDTELDPHSPYGGFWFSHIGWLLDKKMLLEKVGDSTNVADLAKQPFYRFLQKTYAVHGFLAWCLLYAWGGIPYLIWGGPVRVIWVYHITWLVNSACHVWGNQTWKTRDLSKNNWWVAILAFGEGWHNNHHAFEYSARHGLEWWQIDFTWYFIFVLEKLGLAKNVKFPSKEHKLHMAIGPL